MPNVDQLIIVCGISLAVVAGIIWLLMKIPTDEEDDADKD